MLTYMLLIDYDNTQWVKYNVTREPSMEPASFYLLHAQMIYKYQIA